MPTRPGRDVLMEVLEAEGVQYIFGNPGTTEGAIMHALEDRPNLEYILVAQEGVAVGMADGYARESGRPGLRQPAHRNRPLQRPQPHVQRLRRRHPHGRHRRQ